MKLPAARVGERLRVNSKLISYSFWPTKVGPKGNASLQTLLFSLDLGRSLIKRLRPHVQLPRKLKHWPA
ncbi:MAG: hypothetical protein H6R26_736 [Proteobacteria bacterium]|nr:hypothetical protein [Pseudomonadota bacterium]